MNKESYLRVVSMRDDYGYSFAEAGRTLGLTRERVRQMYNVGKMLEKENGQYENTHVPFLSNRAKNGLQRIGVDYTDYYALLQLVVENPSVILSGWSLGKGSFENIKEALKKQTAFEPSYDEYVEWSNSSQRLLFKEIIEEVWINIVKNKWGNDKMLNIFNVGGAHAE